MDRSFLLKKLTPSPIRKILRIKRDNATRKAFAGLGTAEIFSKIYDEGWWSNYRQSRLDFDSGQASHLQYVIDEYVSAISAVTKSYNNIKTVTDLGCGDFNVGRHIAPLFQRYAGVDIVERLIIRNRSKYENEHIRFFCKNIICDEIPDADILLVRQVLQHLSNRDITAFLENIKGRYPHIIVTETMHKSFRYRPNIDIETGPGVRFHKKSGVELDLPPFSMKYVKKSVLCETSVGKEYIVSTHFQMK